MNQPETLVSRDGLAKLQDELDHLVNVRRPAVSARIKEARELGDLKENAEYHDAKNDQALLERRIALLNDQLRRAVEVTDTADSDTIGFGSTVEFRDEDSGKSQTFTLVGSYEARGEAGRLSNESPVARALLGRTVGETVTVQLPRGERRLTIVSVGAQRS